MNNSNNINSDLKKATMAENDNSPVSSLIEIGSFNIFLKNRGRIADEDSEDYADNRQNNMKDSTKVS